MAAKKPKDEVARQWAALHGSNLPRAAASLAQDAYDEQATEVPSWIRARGWL